MYTIAESNKVRTRHTIMAHIVNSTAMCYLNPVVQFLFTNALLSYQQSGSAACAVVQVPGQRVQYPGGSVVSYCLGHRGRNVV